MRRNRQCRHWHTSRCTHRNLSSLLCSAVLCLCGHHAAYHISSHPSPFLAAAAVAAAASFLPSFRPSLFSASLSFGVRSTGAPGATSRRRAATTPPSASIRPSVVMSKQASKHCRRCQRRLIWDEEEAGAGRGAGGEEEEWECGADD